MYVYIYIYREREKYIDTYYKYISIHIYIYICIERERYYAVSSQCCREPNKPCWMGPQVRCEKDVQDFGLCPKYVLGHLLQLLGIAVSSQVWVALLVFRRLRESPRCSATLVGHVTGRNGSPQLFPTRLPQKCA